MTAAPQSSGTRPGSIASPSLLLLLLACATLTVMAGATISPSLPGLLEHFHDVPNAATLVPLILTAPGLAIAVSAPICGWLVDKTDPKLVLVTAICLYIAAGSSGLWLEGLMPILWGRILLGLSVGAVMTSSTTLVAHLWPGPERARVLGYQASAMGFGGVVFILGGGLLADISWRGAFAMYLVPLVLLPLVVLGVPSGIRGKDQPGAAGAPTGFPLAFAAGIYLSTFCIFLIFYMIPTQLPFLLRDLGAEDASTTGFAIAVLTLCSALTSLAFGRLRERVSAAMIGALGFGIVAACYAVIAGAEGLLPVFAAAPFIGIALGAAMPNHVTWLNARVPARMRGRANGFMSMSVFLGQFCSAFAGAGLAAAGGGRGAAFLGLGALSAAIAAVYVGLHLRTRGSR